MQLDMRMVMWLALAVVMLAVVISLRMRDRSADSSFRLDDLLLGEDGRASKAACVMFGAFFLTTWMMVYLTVQGKMTEGYFGLYSAAWIAPTVTALIFRGVKQVAEEKNDNSSGSA